VTLRIALSLSLLLLALVAACAAREEGRLDDDPCGIGTSPSGPVAARAPALVETAAAAAVPALPCGVWVDASEAEADARALAGEPPDVLVFTAGHSTCADAVAIATEKWPGTSVVRYAEEVWRAVPP